jgi:hypothetical protein
MDQISFVLRGGMGPISLPWFHGLVVRQGWLVIRFCIAVLLKRSPRNEPWPFPDKTQAAHSFQDLSQLIG